MGCSILLVALSLTMVLFGRCVAEYLAGFGDFKLDYSPATIHANAQTGELSMTLTNTSGYANGASIHGFDSYKYGSFSVRIKLINGQQDSSGTVCGFYLSSTTGGTTDWDEIDFEFLGNRSGQPMLLHTNLFVNGIGQREQRIQLWFDPTIDFHTYNAIWNHKEIVWLVDNIPIRVHFNVKDPSTGAQNVFPTSPMVGAATIFEGSGWATEGGAVPINPSAQPWTVNFKGFNFEGCLVKNGETGPCEHGYMNNSWEIDWDGLTAAQKSSVNSVRDTYMVSDYCSPDWYNYNAARSAAECDANNAMLV